MKPRIHKLSQKYYGDHVGGTTLFRNMVRSYLTRDSIVLDAGAGSGIGFQHDFRGKVRKVVGLDVVDEVADNPFLDEWVKADICITPFDDCYFDVIFSTYVFEHIQNTAAMVKEIYRILKPGGVLVVRTPNLWHYTTTFSRYTPYWIHKLFRVHLEDAATEDVFPTVYRINTKRKMTKLFKACNFEIDTIQMVERVPSYLMWSVPAFLLGVLYERVVNRFNFLSFFRANIFAVLRKPSV